MSEHQIMRAEEQLPERSGGTSDILRLAVEKNIDPESIQKLAELVWKEQDRRASQEFADALRAFQEECPPILKTRKVEVATRGGSAYHYRFAPLEKIDLIVKPICHSHGLAYSWDSRTDERGQMVVTCMLRHVNGHRESSSFQCPVDGAGSPTMSGAQKAASAMSYARRQSLTAVLGLTSADEDADAGQGPDPVSEEQAAELQFLLDQTDDPEGNLARLLKWARIGNLADLPAAQFDNAKRGIQAKVKA